MKDGWKVLYIGWCNQKRHGHRHVCCAFDSPSVLFISTGYQDCGALLGTAHCLEEEGWFKWRDVMVPLSRSPLVLIPYYSICVHGICPPNPLFPGIKKSLTLPLFAPAVIENDIHPNSKFVVWKLLQVWRKPSRNKWGQKARNIGICLSSLVKRGYF